MELAITALGEREFAAFDAHFARHRAESGRNDIHFMPFAPDGPERPNGLDSRKLFLSLDQPGWQRGWVAWSNTAPDTVVGHVDLKGGGLSTTLHRCELGIGIERDYRGQGVGAALMRTAIDFCRSAASIDYLDLKVFAHNTNARALYAKLGFVETGYVKDLVRTGSSSIDDVMMVLPVGDD